MLEDPGLLKNGRIGLVCVQVSIEMRLYLLLRPRQAFWCDERVYEIHVSWPTPVGLVIEFAESIYIAAIRIGRYNTKGCVI